MAEALHIEVEQVNIKATTEEGLGFTGTEKVFLLRQLQVWIRSLITVTESDRQKVDVPAVADA